MFLAFLCVFFHWSLIHSIDLICFWPPKTNTILIQPRRPFLPQPPTNYGPPQAFGMGDLHWKGSTIILCYVVVVRGGGGVKDFRLIIISTCLLFLLRRGTFSVLASSLRAYHILHIHISKSSELKEHPMNFVSSIQQCHRRTSDIHPQLISTVDCWWWWWLVGLWQR